MSFQLTNTQVHVIPHTHPTSDIPGLVELIEANAVIVSPTAPANPTAGKLWYNTTKGVFNIYNGSAWILVGPEIYPITKAAYDALPAADKNDGRFYLITDNDGTIIVDWANVENKPYYISATAPDTPAEGNLWYDSTNDILKVYDGTNWNPVNTFIEYQAGQNIQINPTTHEISATDTTYTASDFDIKDLTDSTGLRTTWSGKQDTINDLSTIRSGAAAGATAVQPLDNVSGLTNDAGYITNAVSDLTNYYTKTQTYTKAEVDQMISDFGGFEVVEQLPAVATANTHIIYLLGPIGTGGDQYEEWIVTTSEEEDPDTHETVEVKSWTKIGETSVDLSNYFNTFTDTADSINNGTNHLFVSPSEKSTWNAKQDALVSGTNIKTVNGNSLLGSGNVDIPLGKNDIVRSTLPPQDTTVLWYDTVNFVLNYYNDNAWKPLGVVNGGSVEPDYNITGNLWYDINNNVLRVYRVGTGWKDLAYGTSASTAPITVSAGHIWYDTTNNILKVYNGTAWEDVNTNTTYKAGDGIDISNDEISIDTTVVATKTDLNSKQDTISDLATIRSGASAGATAIQPNDNVSELTNDAGYITSSALEDYSTTTEMNNAISTATSGLATESYVNTALSSKQDTLTAGANITIAQDGTISATDTTYTAGTGIDITNGVISNTQTSAEWGNITGTLSDQTDLQDALNDKQDTISDLSTIRSNAAAGKSASDTIATYGDVVTHNASEFATTAQGALADTAVQPGDNVSDLTNDAGYITNSALNGYATESYVDTGLAAKADKSELPTKTSDLTNDSGFITNAVNDLANYYTKTETYTKTEVDNLIASVGSFEVVSTLPSADTADTKKIYLLGPIGTGADKYEEWIVTEDSQQQKQWTKIGETSIDLSGYATTTAMNTALLTKADATDVNTKTFTLSSTSDLTTAQAAYDWYAAGKNPIIIYNSIAYILAGVSTGRLKFAQAEHGVAPYGSYTKDSYLTVSINHSSGTVSSVTVGLDEVTSYLDTSTNYSTPYTPTYAGSPATKKYVDDNVVQKSATAPYSPTEGMVWYDTTNDLLKVYDGTQWDEVGGGGGATYTAGDGIDIDANNEISVDVTDIIGTGLTEDASNNIIVDTTVVATQTDLSGKQDKATSGSTAPSTTPSYVGQQYIDTTADKMYVATGTSSSSDWIEVGAGGSGSGDMQYSDFNWVTKTGASITLDLNSYIAPSADFTVNAPATIKDGQIYVLRVATGLVPYTMTLGTNITNPYSEDITLTTNTLSNFSFVATGGNLELQPSIDITGVVTGSYAAAKNGTDLSLVTTGEKYIWGDKESKPTSGSGEPSIIPTYVGQRYFRTSNSTWYVATGTSSSSDWTEVGAGSGDMLYADFNWVNKTGATVTLDINSTITPSANFTVNAPSTIKDGQIYILRVVNGATVYTMTLGTGITNPYSTSTTLTTNGVDQFVFQAIGGSLELLPDSDVDITGKQDKATTGTAAPSSTPTYVGQSYVNTSTTTPFVATGTSASTDWQGIPILSKQTGAATNVKIWVGTQAAYEALSGSYDANTLYFTTSSS